MRAEAREKARAREAPRGPSSEDVRAAQQMSPEDRQAMIRGMVDGLAEKLKQNPDDLDGWLRLARSYGVLDEAAKSRDAYARRCSTPAHRNMPRSRRGSTRCRLYRRNKPRPRGGTSITDRAFDPQKSIQPALPAPE